MNKDHIITIPETNTTVVYLCEDIVADKSQFIELFKVLRLAKSGDIIELEINTNGGSDYTGASIITNILRSKAKVIANVQIAFSAGAYIALACDEIRPMPMCQMMLHPASWQVTANPNNVKIQADFSRDYYDKWDHIIYDRFLTKTEILEQQNGKEFWLNEEDIKKRLKKFIPLRERIHLSNELPYKKILE